MPNLIRLTNIIHDSEWNDEEKKMVSKTITSDIFINPYAIILIGMEEAHLIDEKGENAWKSYVTIHCERELQFYVTEALDTVVNLFNEAM
jgi:hypothetical protein